MVYCYLDYTTVCNHFEHKLEKLTDWQKKRNAAIKIGQFNFSAHADLLQRVEIRCCSFYIDVRFAK